jgi:hypothetical protein
MFRRHDRVMGDSPDSAGRARVPKPTTTRAYVALAVDRARAGAAVIGGVDAGLPGPRAHS